jgi:hydroxypyruvate reductase
MPLKYQELDDHSSILIAAALSAADPGAAVREAIRCDSKGFSISNHHLIIERGKLYLIAAGKASLAMSLAAIDILGDRFDQGIIIAKHSESDASEESRIGNALPDSVQLYRGAHPISDSSSVRATVAVTNLLEDTAKNDIVLCLISGGTSSLLTEPRIPLYDWQLLIDALLSSGCTINELNSVRKQLDRVKAGGLARLAYPARCYSLILSDVVGNALDVIGSGPTVQNLDPPFLARQILERYEIGNILAADIWNAIEEQLSLAERETEKSQIEVVNFIIGDVRRAAEAAVHAAVSLGFSTTLLTARLEGEAREIGKVAASLAKDAMDNSCLVLGGETTVTVRGNGKGGRNQELALAAAVSLEGWERTAIISFATDGEDGPTDAAGAIVTGETVARARNLSIYPLLYLDQNDSYHFFEKVGGHIRTGSTGTNVNDLVFILKYAQ